MLWVVPQTSSSVHFFVEVVLGFNVPVNNLTMVMSRRSVGLTIFFLGRLRPKRLTNRTYLVHILSPVTDNCPSWISGRERMAIEIISWPISMKECFAGLVDLTCDCLNARPHVFIMGQLFFVKKPSECLRIKMSVWKLRIIRVLTLCVYGVSLLRMAELECPENHCLHSWILE